MATVTSMKPLTTDQRFAIRDALDKHFDDKQGFYLDGMSDHKIAEQLNVPRIEVEKIRELAYGPIKVHPEVASMRAAIGNLTTQIEGQQKGLDNLKARLTELEGRIEKFERVAA